jgi:hypothetical protein
MQRAEKNSAERVHSGVEADDGRKKGWEATMTTRLIVVGLAAILAFTGSLSAQELVVQVVESGWLPLPGTEISLSSVASCGQPNSALGERVTALTDRRGFALFHVPADARYRVDVSAQAGFEARTVCIRLFERSVALPTAYVQIQTKVSVTP